MKKNQSFIIFKVKDKPEHPISKVIIKKFADLYLESELIFSPRFSPDCGWYLDGMFIGLTIKECISHIEHRTGSIY